MSDIEKAVTMEDIYQRDIEARAAYNKVVDNDKSTDDEITKAEKEYRAAVEKTEKDLKELREAQKKPDVPTDTLPEVRMASYLSNYAQGMKVTGAEAELNQELKLDDVTMIPWEALVTEAREAELEKRADVPVETSALPENTTLHPILSRVFKRAVAGQIGIDMPMVGAGQQDYPVMTGGTTAAVVAEKAGHDAAKASFTTKSVSAKRITGSYLFTLESVARLGDTVETTLRNDLNAVLSDAFDSQILNGDGTGANFTGLAKSVAISGVPGGDGAVFTWAQYRSLLLDALDGTYALTEGDLRCVLGLGSYRKGRSVFRTANTDGPDAIAAMRALGSQVLASSKIASVETAAKSSKKADYEGALITSEPSSAIAPVWQGVQMIRDPYTNAKTGQVLLTFNMMANFVLKTARAWKHVAVTYNSKAA